MGKRGPNPKKSTPISVRLSTQLKRQLEEARKRSGRTLTQEIEKRLKAFDDPDDSDPFTSGFLLALTQGLRAIETYSEKRWHEDRWTYNEFRALVDLVFPSPPEGDLVAPRDSANFPGTSVVLPRGKMDAQIAAVIVRSILTEIAMKERRPIDAHQREAGKTVGVRWANDKGLMPPEKSKKV